MGDLPILFSPTTKILLVYIVTGERIKVKVLHRSDTTQEVCHLTCEITDYVCIVGEILKSSFCIAAGNEISHSFLQFIRLK